MTQFKETDLQQWTQGQWYGLEFFKQEIQGFSNDTRQLKPGNVFVALSSASQDGHHYLQDAFSKGASCAIVKQVNVSLQLPQLKVDDPLKALQVIAHQHRLQFHKPVIAVTGSCGKTSTKDLLKLLLGPTTHATEANYNNLIGVPLTLTEIDAEKHTAAVVEAGMNIPGEMQQLGQIIQPDITVVTLIAPCHLGGLGSIQAIAEEKAYLGHAVRRNGRLFLPESCLRHEPFKHFHVPSTLLAETGFNYEKKFADDEVWCFETEFINPLSAKIHLWVNAKERISYEFPSTNKGMLSNATLAILVAIEVGVPRDQIQERLLEWVPSKKRGQIYNVNKQYFYSDCYNASPVSMLNAIEHFQLTAPQELSHLYVLGCMGELGKDSAQLHYDIGTRFRIRSQDQIIIIKNEILEQAEVFRRGMIDVGNDPEKIIICHDREEAHRSVQYFEGAIFLKGSKRLELWKILPSETNNIEYAQLPISLLC